MRNSIIVSLFTCFTIMFSAACSSQTHSAEKKHEQSNEMVEKIAEQLPEVIEPLTIEDSVWLKQLSPEAYEVLRKKGTERAFTGQYWKHDKVGVYLCNGCGLPLFASSQKFNSSCGWPSFYDVVRSDLVKEKEDHSHGMNRTEIVCSRCDGHLGHVFNDGPEPTGLRYCINSASLEFRPFREINEEKPE